MTTYTAWGFDFAYGNGITTATLLANGCNFVCRYLSGTPGSGKDLSATEIENYKAAGINLVLNWETDGLMPSESTGVSAAQAAQAEAGTLASQSGVPAVAAAPIIFSADFDPTGNTAGIIAYMTGVASVLGHSRTGLYGGYAGIQAYFNANIGQYGWQTYAWSNGLWDGRAQLQQWNNNVTVGPTQVDQDRATATDYGQVEWSTPPPNPEPINQEDEYQMELKTGAGAFDVMRFPVFPSYLFLFTDIGATGGNPTKVRVALHKSGPDWDGQEVTLTVAAPGVILPLPANAYDGVSFARQDDGPPVAVSWR